jgi:hypothetical protein
LEETKFVETFKAPPKAEAAKAVDEKPAAAEAKPAEPTPAETKPEETTS